MNKKTKLILKQKIYINYRRMIDVTKDGPTLKCGAVQCGRIPRSSSPVFILNRLEES